MADIKQARIEEIEKQLAQYQEQLDIQRKAGQPVGEAEDAIARLIAEKSRAVFSEYCLTQSQVKGASR